MSADGASHTQTALFEMKKKNASGQLKITGPQTRLDQIRANAEAKGLSSSAYVLGRCAVPEEQAGPIYVGYTTPEGLKSLVHVASSIHRMRRELNKGVSEGRIPTSDVGDMVLRKINATLQGTLDALWDRLA